MLLARVTLCSAATYRIRGVVAKRATNKDNVSDDQILRAGTYDGGDTIPSQAYYYLFLLEVIRAISLSMHYGKARFCVMSFR